MITYIAVLCLATAGVAAGFTRCVQCNVTVTGSTVLSGSYGCQDSYSAGYNSKFGVYCLYGCAKIKSTASTLRVSATSYRRGCSARLFPSQCYTRKFNVLGVDTEAEVCHCSGHFCNNAPNTENYAILLIVAFLSFLNILM